MLVYLEDNQKKKYLIENENFNIGRDGSQCQLKLPENLLFSALQAIIVVQEDVPILEKFVLVDKSSNKNTFVNGKRIDKKILKHGDRIAFARDQNVSFTFKVNISDPTIVPDAESFVKPKLEEKKQDLQSTIKESTAESLTSGPKILDKEIEDLRNLMQNNMMKSNVDSALIETKDEIVVPPESFVVSPVVEKEQIKSSKMIGEETEIDTKVSDKMLLLREAYSKFVEKGTSTPGKSASSGGYICSLLDGNIYKTEKEITIGSSPEASISFTKDTMAQTNAKIIATEQGIVFNPLEYTNIIVNGSCIQKSLVLKNKDVIRIGKQVLYFFENENEATELSAGSKQKKKILRNFHTIQECSNEIDSSFLQLRFQVKLCDKENTLYFVSKNQQNVFVLVGDIIGANLAFTLLAQELRGAFNIAVNCTGEIKDIIHSLNGIVKKYTGYSCEDNTPITGKLLLFKFSATDCEYTNLGGHLLPVLVSGETAQDLVFSKGMLPLGYLVEETPVETEVFSFSQDTILLVQPDCSPSSKTTNFKKLLLQSKDIHQLVTRLPKDGQFSSSLMKHVLSSNVTSMIGVTRKSSDVKCVTCQRSFPAGFLFCPYDSTKLV